MCDRRTFLLTSAAIAFGIVEPVASAAETITYDKLFFIQRSKNANEVHYDARVTASGALDAKDPMIGYWINKAEGGTRSGLTFAERVAYGYDCVEVKDRSGWRLVLKAFPERTMWLVKTDSGRWRARTVVSGRHAYVSKLFVATDESGAFPKVLFVDIYGEDVRSGAVVREHLEKK